MNDLGTCEISEYDKRLISIIFITSFEELNDERVSVLVCITLIACLVLNMSKVSLDDYNSFHMVVVLSVENNEIMVNAVVMIWIIWIFCWIVSFSKFLRIQTYIDWMSFLMFFYFPQTGNSFWNGQLCVHIGQKMRSTSFWLVETIGMFLNLFLAVKTTELQWTDSLVSFWIACPFRPLSIMALHRFCLFYLQIAMVPLEI